MLKSILLRLSMVDKLPFGALPTNADSNPE